jgi:hypothetical protein
VRAYTGRQPFLRYRCRTSPVRAYTGRPSLAQIPVLVQDIPGARLHRPSLPCLDIGAGHPWCAPIQAVRHCADMGLLCYGTPGTVLVQDISGAWAHASRCPLRRYGALVTGQQAGFAPVTLASHAKFCILQDITLTTGLVTMLWMGRLPIPLQSQGGWLRSTGGLQVVKRRAQSRGDLLLWLPDQACTTAACCTAWTRRCCASCRTRSRTP